MLSYDAIIIKYSILMNYDSYCKPSIIRVNFWVQLIWGINLREEINVTVFSFYTLK